MVIFNKRKKCSKKYYSIIMEELIKSYSLLIDSEEILNTLKGSILDFFHVDEVNFFKKTSEKNYKCIVKGEAYYIEESSRLVFWLNNNNSWFNVDGSIKQYVNFNLNKLSELNPRYIFPMKTRNKLILIVFISSPAICNEDMNFLLLALKLTAMAYENSSRFSKELKKLDMEHEASKLETMERMASSIAHEIKNPLTYIRSTIQFLSNELDDRITKDTLNNIIEEVDRVNTITRDLLEFSKHKNMNIEKVCLNEIINNVFSLFRQTLEKQSIKTIIDFDEEIYFINADENAFKQVLVNLMINSIDAMYDSAEKTLTIRIAQNNEGKFIMQWGDTGSGIDPDNMKKIFDPFFTTKKKGSGLGLAVIQQVLKQHNFYYEVLSKPEKGTIFTIFFDVAERKLFA